MKITTARLGLGLTGIAVGLAGAASASTSTATPSAPPISHIAWSSVAATTGFDCSTDAAVVRPVSLTTHKPAGSCAARPYGIATSHDGIHTTVEVSPAKGDPAARRTVITVVGSNGRVLASRVLPVSATHPAWVNVTASRGYAGAHACGYIEINDSVSGAPHGAEVKVDCPK